jgi:hypothetical protein
MIILRPGHRYELANFEDPSKPGQVIQFIEKERRTDHVPELVTLSDGTTNEEVLAMLIDRLQALNAKLPNRDTSIAITHCEDALLRLEKRTRDRKARGVEGTPKA